MTANKQRATARIGTSGYQYDHWVGVLYPEEAPKKSWFAHYARSFDTVEINNTFYSLPASKTFDAWRERAPVGFCYVLKFSRYGTHLKRLKEPGDTIATFLERAERLKGRLGPILVQLPPHWKANPQRLAAFLDEASPAHRWAVEFRDPDWLRRDIYDLLAAHNAALVVHDLIPDHPRVTTADWVYLRFHGPTENGPYGGNYSYQALNGVARRIRKHLGEGRDVFAFFNNDAKGYAVRNAADLGRYLEDS
ncbi:MAG: DUF72 domain-containing protein [bacterium]